MRDLVDFLKDLRRFIFTNKRYWLVPILIVFFLLGLITLLSHPMAAVPFIYTLF